ncbi:MAG: lipoprotein signal peptidase [Flavobacteriaceae bacterium]|nr:lipoprotein signal peptidase [Flavobacteriaceae bacterium]MCY4267145.1 lipoprotein signal peptidase [Flavobacteriaceae bacterium]
MYVIFKTIKIHWVVLVILGVLLLDQSLKFYIKLNYPISSFHSPSVIDWGFFRVLFVENPGMALGTRVSDIIPIGDEDTAKLILTFFRIIVITGIGLWLFFRVLQKQSRLLKWSVALIFAGALGNLTDSIFYGVIFSHSYGQIAEFLPQQGYAPLFLGHVVDFIQFPLVTWVWPQWLPLVGGESYTFFQYVFNIADTAITTGVLMILVFGKRITRVNNPPMTIEIQDES